MRGPRTIFGPFALAAAIALGFALGRYERFETEAQQQEQTQLAKVGKPRLQARQSPRSERRGGRRAELIVPVEGLTRADLADSWGHARSQGRSHEGIDIMTPAGTRVHAVADGRIVKFFDSERGGITIYQFDQSERFVFYYAHLQARAQDLAEGDYVQQGDVIGYVGQSGNATTPHLHFEIQRLTPERHWWVADSVNPYPYLVAGNTPD
jgi:peptidoglycan LD-endopeptidase LytH